LSVLTVSPCTVGMRWALLRALDVVDVICDREQQRPTLCSKDVKSEPGIEEVSTNTNVWGKEVYGSI
jgi:hypothetical protein